jgi:streptomycin 6-kinase
VRDLTRLLAKWNLSDPRILARTATSDVYLVALPDGGDAVLKVLNDLGKKDESGGAIALRCFEGKGAVRLLAYDDAAHLLEYAAGEDLTKMVKEGRDEVAASVIANVLRELHGAWSGHPPAELRPLRAWFRALFEKAGDDRRKNEKSIFATAADAAERLLATAKKTIVLHGDIHHENIRMSSRGWLALDPKGLVGDPDYDAANALFNPVGMTILVESATRLRRIAVILSENLETDPERIITYAFIHACLSHCWDVEDGQAPNPRWLKMAELAQPHII